LLKSTKLSPSKKRVSGRLAQLHRSGGAQSQAQTTAQQQTQVPIPDGQGESPQEQVAEPPQSDEMEKFRKEAAKAGNNDDAGEGQDHESDGSDMQPLTPPEPEMQQELSANAAKQKAYMMQFIKQAMAGAGKDKNGMNNFEKFGVSLFLAGACEVLGAKTDLDEDAISRIMSDSVQTMGFKKVHAKGFADKHAEYLIQDASYMKMFQSGRNAMNIYRDDENSIARNMSASMQDWNKPKKKEADTGPVTVLFTDIAGSTAMTQKYGDAGAQEIVRAHNKIVREALTIFSGREIKHTGDGIMASFNRTSDSIDASIQIQRETNQYTTATPERPLYIKIGINAGEPIAEDNDLFGTTVQMAARIVDKALADQIFTSEIVQGICAGKTYNFVSRGTYQMKGFDKDPTLYEVMWQDA
jgi:adenylate cyclase